MASKAKEMFLDLLKESVIVQSVVTVVLIGTVCAMYLVPLAKGADMSTVTIPPLLAGLTGTVMGYWFKSKAELQARKLR